MKFETLLIHGGDGEDALTGAVNPPIYQTSTYRQTGLGVHKGYEYSRTKNPTRTVVEQLIAQMEEGSDGFAFASGMAAITTVLSLFSQGDHLLIADNLYGGTYRVLDKVFQRFGLTYTALDTTELEVVAQGFKDYPQTKAILLESPTNPLLSVSDLKAISTLAHKHQALSIVDNTFMTPYLQKPLTLGADIVIHSATKYLGGHSDLVAGLVAVNDEALASSIGFLQNAMGAILGPQDSYLLIRGIKTLALRMDRHIENTNTLVDYLERHPLIEKVYHPRLENFKNHDIFMSQTKGSVGLISFVLKPEINLEQFVASLQVITLGESLGGVESLISHPASMTHASYPKEIREAVGIVNGLVRLSVGIEHIDDLQADLAQALELAR